MEKQTPIKLSAVVISFNEEDKISRCIDSLIEVADEIIVVDSLSTDRTVEICTSMGATVISQSFLGYIEQKNFALGQTNYDYVLSIDADEVISDKLKLSILDIKNNCQYDAYNFNRLTSYCGKWIKHGGWYPDTKLRLWKKDLGKWGGTNPHDTVIVDKDIKIGKLNGDLLHYSIDSIHQHIDQIQKFTTIAANAMYSNGRKATIINVLFNPLFKFVRDYILRLGFLDGYYGFVVALNSSFASFLKYTKLRDLNNKNR